MNHRASNRAQIRMLPDGRRLHMHDGPIDIIVEAFGAASEVEAMSTVAFDANDPDSLERFFMDLPATIDHVMVTAGRPTYGRLVDMDLAEARRALDGHFLLMLQVEKSIFVRKEITFCMRKPSLSL